MRDSGRMLTVALALALLGSVQCVAFQITDSAPVAKRNTPPPIRKVAVNISGDTTLAHRLWTMLVFELEDADFVPVPSEDKADAILSGTIEKKGASHRRKLGVIRATMEFPDGTNGKLDSCAGLGDIDGKLDLFDKSAKGFIYVLKDKFPNLKTISIGQTSDLDKSSKFRDQLVEELSKAQLILTNRENADATVQLRLEEIELPVTRFHLTYKLDLSRTGGRFIASEEGGAGSWDEFGEKVPEACESNFSFVPFEDSRRSFYMIGPKFVRLMKQKFKGDSTIELPIY